MNREAVALGVPGVHEFRRDGSAPSTKASSATDVSGPCDRSTSSKVMQRTASTGATTRDPAQLLDVLLTALDA